MRGGRRRDRARRALLRPARRRPGDPRGRHARARGRRQHVSGVLEVARALAPSVPVVLMCYANMVFAPGARGVRRAPGENRRVRADRARPAAGGGPRGARGVRASTASRSCRSSRRRRRPSAWPRSARARGAFSTRSRSSAPPASASALRRALRRGRRAREGRTTVPVALGFGIEHPRAGASRPPTRGPTA